MARNRRMGSFANILDASGNVVGRVDKKGTLYGLGENREFIPWGSIGGDIWEFFNPGQVQQEYEMSGKIGAEPPPIVDIMGGAAEDATVRAAENIQQGAQAVVDNASVIGKWLVIGLVAYAIIQVMPHVPKGRK